MTETPPIVLTLAGSDPSGGAGLQADILTIASLGCHPLSVVTALTVQDTTGVEDVLAIDADWVADQARHVLEDMPVAAFKIGMLGSVENVARVAEIMSDYPEIPLVLDPVLASGRGDDLAGDDIVRAIRELLVPQATLITPNSLEARRLAGDDAEDEQTALDDCAQLLLASGCEYVLITGTHENTTDVHNTLYGPDGLLIARAWPRLPGSYHGSGCTLASAIAASLAQGMDVAGAVQEAQEYTWNTLAAAFRPGMGQFVPDRFFWASPDNSHDADPD